MRLARPVMRIAVACPWGRDKLDPASSARLAVDANAVDRCIRAVQQPLTVAPIHVRRLHFRVR